MMRNSTSAKNTASKYSVAGALIIAQLFSQASAENKEKQQTSPPLGGTTPSKTLNNRLDLTKYFNEIMVVTAKQYFTDYQANEAAADLKYKGKPFILKGSVSRISKDFMNATYLAFWGDQYGLKAVNAHLFNEQICTSSGQQTICSAEQRAATVKKKDIITLECFGAGMVIQAPIATKCLIAP